MSTRVTAEQILQDAYENRDRPLDRPEQTIQDLDELRSFQLTKRREYEQQLNKNRLNFGQWVRYAKWEVEYNHDFQRARSIYERALQVNIEHIPFWIHYIQLELKSKNINHARNLLERAVTSLPRVDKFWYLYVQTEESLGNYDMVRVIFERWLTWYPQQGAWDSFIGFEKRYEEFDNVRLLYSRYVERFNYSGEVWMKWIQFETRQGDNYERSVFESAVDSMVVAWKERLGGDPALEDKEDGFFAEIIDKWTRWEVSVDETDRARAIFSKLLEIIGEKEESSNSSGANLIRQLYTEFEKTYGDENSIEDSIYAKRLVRYRIELESDPSDFDSWWAYLKLTEKVKGGNKEEMCKIFEEAIANVPSDLQKSIRWKRYIYLWIHYALFVEFNPQEPDVERARTIWNRCAKIVPNNRFVFGKVWIMFAEFEIRNGGTGGEISSARKVLGRSIGVCSSIGKPKNKIFRFYIGLEKKLGDWERCRKIYEKWLEIDMKATSTLIEYITFERDLEEHSRAVGLFEIGMELNAESIWKPYVSYLQEKTEFAQARQVYRRVIDLDLSKSAVVWIAFAMFESRIPTEEQLRSYEAGEIETEGDEMEFSITDVQRNNTRRILQEALKALKLYPEQRIVILEAYKHYEERQGNSETVQEVIKKFPTAVTKRRTDENGLEEEYIEYIFPEDEQKKPEVSKFLANAKKWMQQSKN